MAQAAISAGNVLRVATVWGTTVLAVQHLDPGQSFALRDRGEGVGGIRPDGVEASDVPFRAAGSSWEVDARGVRAGVIRLRGREEDATGMVGAPVPVVLGDWGLLQYGAYALFFQLTEAAPPLARPRRRNVLVGLSWLSSAVLHVGIFGLVRALTTPTPLPKPAELSNAEEIAARFGIRRAFIEEAPPPTAAEAPAAAGAQAAASDARRQGGGKKMAESEGRFGRNGDKARTEIPDDGRRGLGGVSDVLASDAGDEIKHTLGTISSVAAALGGLNSQTLLLGSGSGFGLKGTGPGGGGVGAGVPFGSGTLETGWSTGRGGGLGNGLGGGGPGGRGGAGSAGAGTGKGGSPAERQMAVASGAGTGSGGLSQEQIRRVVMAHLGALRACYESEAERNPNLRGGVTVEWQIAPEGSVTGANLGGSSLGNARVEGCVVRQVKAWRFPSSASASRVSWPFKFGLAGGG